MQVKPFPPIKGDGTLVSIVTDFKKLNRQIKQSFLSIHQSEMVDEILKITF